MTNILRDCARDLQTGRCYLPKNILDTYGLSVDKLLIKDASILARQILHYLLCNTLEQYLDACEYVLVIPRHFIRLRLACLWPILIGIETLKLLVQHPAWLDPHRLAKISGWRIYRILSDSFIRVSSNFVIRTRILESVTSITIKCI